MAPVVLASLCGRRRMVLIGAQSCGQWRVSMWRQIVGWRCGAGDTLARMSRSACGLFASWMRRSLVADSRARWVPHLRQLVLLLNLCQYKFDR